MKYSDLNLKTNTKTNVAILNNGKEVEVLQYLPIKDKIDLIEIALQKSRENGVFNEMKLEMYFNLYLIEMYTNLEFTDEEKMNETLLYDELESNHVITDIIAAMNAEEYGDLISFLDMTRNSLTEYYNSVPALLQTFIEDMPANAEAASQIVDNFDPEKYQNVLNFAKAANGGRDIK